MNRRVSRRALLQGAASAAALGTLGVPSRKAHAAEAERKFLFFFAGGGWDTTTVLDPHLGSAGVDMDPGTTVGEVGNLRFTASPDRPAVSLFFQRWGQRTAIVNGIDCHSVGHESATQLVLTGTSASSTSDWPTLLAAHTRAEYPLPHLVFSGPAYPGSFASAVVRAGGGTLLDLIDASLVGAADLPAPILQAPSDAMVDAFVYERATRYANGLRGGGRDRAEALVTNLDRSFELEGRRFEAGLDELGSTLLDQAIKASEMFRLGLSRCAMISIPGGWDSHGSATEQGLRQEVFYQDLNDLFDHLATTPGHSATWLIDEVVVVALSEFGRTPLLNGGGGKDHWPYGSALVAGSGVSGDRVIGSTDDGLIANPIDLSTGLASSTGDQLGCEHLGTALLRLGGLDPAAFLPGVATLGALLRA